MHTALLSTESQSDFNLILELAKKLNLKTKILLFEDSMDFDFFKASESSLYEWLTPQENEAWKNL